MPKKFINSRKFLTIDSELAPFFLVLQPPKKKSYSTIINVLILKYNLLFIIRTASGIKTS